MKLFGKVAIPFLITLLIQGCATRDQVQTNPKPTAINEDLAKPTETPGEPEDAEFDYYDLKQSLGLVSIKEIRFGKNQVMRLYNQDGTLWFALSLDDEETARETIERKEDFHPFRADHDDWSFVFNCVRQDRRYYHVVVNEDTGSKKFIRKDESHFKLGTWEQYILDCFAVDFKAADNPLREEPNGRPILVAISKGSTFHPDKIDGDWLKVRWSAGDDGTRGPNFGWIKWKENNRIVIFFFETRLKPSVFRINRARSTTNSTQRAANPIRACLERFAQSQSRSKLP